MSKKRKSRIEIEKIMRFVERTEEIGKDEFPITADYVNFCLLSKNGMIVHDVFLDAYIGNRLR